MDTLTGRYWAVSICNDNIEVRVTSYETKRRSAFAKYILNVLDNDYLSFDVACVYVKYSMNNLRETQGFGFAKGLSQLKLNLYNAFNFMLTKKDCTLFIKLL